ncbi:MAG: type I-U CRISPR-associated protein Cas7 [Acidimicrobiia bacterium]|nr:type I-U CRISPR-associated protein Cas7 [Acidimicrobiia bacterium]
MNGISYDELQEAVGGDGVGVRTRIHLEPLGGEGDKVFPPTYAVSDSAETKYAIESRRIKGEDKRSVLLDSVASQANRQELALLEAIRADELAIPLVSVDFREVNELADLDRLSVLEAPHRIYDAILRDSLLDGTLFRHTDIGRSITEATPRSAAALFHFSPTTLLFGGWDSTGPKGGRGSKFERTVTSEVVAVGISEEPGVKTASRIDPLGVELSAGPIYETDDGGWTTDESEARTEKGKPVPYEGGGEGKAGRPSHVNHGNVTPSIDDRAGGVTADQILGISVLSFIALRRLRFPVDHEGVALEAAKRRDAERAARTALAALGLAAITLAYEEGFDLRSRCVLAPTGPLTFELLRRGGGDPTLFSLDGSAALDLVRVAQDEAGKLGLGWHDGEVLLTPAQRLVDLVRRSRQITESETPDGE